MTKEFQEYIDAVDDARKSMLLDLLELILQMPPCVQKKSYGILMFHSPRDGLVWATARVSYPVFRSHGAGSGIQNQAPQARCGQGMHPAET
jgi:hypothetical protein